MKSIEAKPVRNWSQFKLQFNHLSPICISIQNLINIWEYRYIRDYRFFFLKIDYRFKGYRLKPETLKKRSSNDQILYSVYSNVDLSYIYIIYSNTTFKNLPNLRG